MYPLELIASPMRAATEFVGCVVLLPAQVSESRSKRRKLQRRDEEEEVEVEVDSKVELLDSIFTSNFCFFHAEPFEACELASLEC